MAPAPGAGPAPVMPESGLAQEDGPVSCYVHAKAGESKDAVAVCKVCGMGLCLDHAVERDVPLQKLQSVGMAGYAARTMVILCQRDAKEFPES